MKKIKLATFVMAISQLFLMSGANLVLAVETVAPEITVEQKAAIMGNCEAIRKSLQNVQHQDSRMRVYYGRYFETIYSKFIVPLNMRLTENNLLNDNLLNNQTKFAEMRTDFSSDYVDYQKTLESLVAVNCKEEPEKFYDLLVQTRSKRQMVNDDIIGIRKIITAHIDLVKNLKENL